MAKKPVLKSYSTSRIKFDYDMEEFQKNIDRIITDIKSETKKIVIESSTEFASAAAKFTPPCIGKNSIEKKYYTRPYLNLKKLIKGQYEGHTHTKRDIEQFRKKMRYKVLNTKKGMRKDVAFGYCKTKSQAKKMAKIANRGLARVLWGRSLHDIGAIIPNNIIRLMDKSPDMTNRDLSEVKYRQNNDENEVTITNNFQNISSFGRFAQQHGMKKASSYINKKVRQISQKDQEI